MGNRKRRSVDGTKKNTVRCLAIAIVLALLTGCAALGGGHDAAGTEAAQGAGQSGSEAAAVNSAEIREEQAEPGAAGGSDTLGSEAEPGAAAQKGSDSKAAVAEGSGTDTTDGSDADGTQIAPTTGSSAGAASNEAQNVTGAEQGLSGEAQSGDADGTQGSDAGEAQSGDADGTQGSDADGALSAAGATTSRAQSSGGISINSTEGEAYAGIYAPVITGYYAAFADGFDRDELRGAGLCEIWGDAFSGGNLTAGYAYEDFNNDGTPELIIADTAGGDPGTGNSPGDGGDPGDGSVDSGDRSESGDPGDSKYPVAGGDPGDGRGFIYGIYSIVDGEAVPLAQSSESSLLYLLEDDVVLKYDFESSPATVRGYYVYEGGSGLNFIEALVYDPSYGDGPYFYADSESCGHDDYLELEEGEFEYIADEQYVRKSLELTAFN